MRRPSSEAIRSAQRSEISTRAFRSATGPLTSSRVASSRALDYVREFNTALAPWRREPAAREFVHRTRKDLGVSV